LQTIRGSMRGWGSEEKECRQKIAKGTDMKEEEQGRSARNDWNMEGRKRARRGGEALVLIRWIDKGVERRYKGGEAGNEDGGGGGTKTASTDRAEGESEKAGIRGGGMANRGLVGGERENRFVVNVRPDEGTREEGQG